MKKIICAFAFFAVLLSASAQNGAAKLPPVDKSPLDMAYYPANYPILKIQDKANEPLLARVIYSRPLKAGRTTFGELVEYNTVWRLGANEATEVEFYRDVKIAGKRVPKGRYSLYAIAQPNEWTMILNKDTDIWGAFKYNEKKDVLRTVVPVQKSTEPVEAFTMMFDKTSGGANLIVAWDEVKVALPIQAATTATGTTTGK